MYMKFIRIHFCNVGSCYQFPVARQGCGCSPVCADMSGAYDKERADAGHVRILRISDDMMCSDYADANDECDQDHLRSILTQT